MGWAANGTPDFFEHPSGEISPRIRALTLQLAADMIAHPDAARSHEKTLSDLMIAVIERFTAWRGFPSSIRGTSALSCGWRIRRVMEAMRVRKSDASIDQFMKGAGLSRAHFFRLFAASIGVSPKLYLNVLQMELALDAVMRENPTLAELSERFGFSEPALFSRFFRDRTGVNPREFRNVSRLAS